RSPVELEDILCQIHTDHRIVHLPSSFSRGVNTTTLAHRDAVSGGRQPFHLCEVAMLALHYGFRGQIVIKCVQRDLGLIQIREIDQLPSLPDKCSASTNGGIRIRRSHSL
ncbi:MAG: hypothetical protein AAFQ34_15995, partial [Pseudomonadota bacterium]